MDDETDTFFIQCQVLATFGVPDAMVNISIY